MFNKIYVSRPLFLKLGNDKVKRSRWENCVQWTFQATIAYPGHMI